MAMMAIVAMMYALHLIAFPAGWATPDPGARDEATSRPADATMGENGTVAVILADKNPAQKILIVRPDWTTTILRSPVFTLTLPNFPTAAECRNDARDCASFAKIALAQDGTPFVTFETFFSGAYSGVREVALVWDGAWHAVPDALPFHGLVKPIDPRNVSIAAASSRSRFAFVSDYADLFPMEDIDLAISDPHWMVDISGVTLDSRTIPLSIGDATAMRGRFVAGFDAGLKLVATQKPSVALRWDCVDTVAAEHPCARVILGPGVAYGVDSQGDVVGDDEASLAHFGPGMPFDTLGSPVLWRDQRVVVLSSEYGAAYAIGEAGTIVGTIRAERNSPLYGRYSGFVADARAAAPRAQPLDPLVTNLGGLHVLAAFGVSGRGRILVLVIRKNDWRGARRLGVLVPE